MLRCILSKFYIKPQLDSMVKQTIMRCILSKFYIKPQLIPPSGKPSYGCILSKFYIKPQLRSGLGDKGVGCILSKFYIKPQHRQRRHRAAEVVSYRNSTSNHNNARRQWKYQQLYLIEILHQTTTFPIITLQQLLLYLIEILHQTTTRAVLLLLTIALYLIEILHQTTTISARDTSSNSCILSKFYIKPQPIRRQLYV